MTGRAGDLDSETSPESGFLESVRRAGMAWSRERCIDVLCRGVNLRLQVKGLLFGPLQLLGVDVYSGHCPVLLV